MNVNYDEIFRIFEYEGFKIYVVDIRALICVTHDKKSKIFIDTNFWKSLSRDERKALISHELEELKLINKGLSWWKAHLIATSKDNFEVRKRIIWKCHATNMRKLGLKLKMRIK